MASKPLLSLFFILSSWVFMGFSQSLDSFLIHGGSTVHVDSMPCMKKLLPCQQFLKSTTAPSPSCCFPLTEMISDDSKCLCNVFNNPDFLKSLNVTQDDALKLAKACGANPDISICKKDAPAPSSSIPIPVPPTSKNDTITNENSTSSTAKSSATQGGTHFGVYGFGALLVALVFSAF
ncbi:Lipid transfer protein [Quillaja saponaria]|uniref:Lipid transfer protein n=1 Tax=Quillaja saponaria TaxID=32244 RepID=A0AAD7PWN1_QUISA|nr:Lipid transfer protein [Quillaja saponaria]